MESLTTEELVGALFQCRSVMMGDTHGIPAFLAAAMFGESSLRTARTVLHEDFYLRDMGGYSLLYITRNGFQMLANARNHTAKLPKAAYLDWLDTPALSEECVVLHNWYLWRNSGDRPAYGCLRRYCKYIAAHGYHGGEKKAWSDLLHMDRDSGAAWICMTYARYACERRSG